MVPQHGSDMGTASSGTPLFGSQLVDKNSATPYSDATQVTDAIFENFRVFFTPRPFNINRKWTLVVFGYCFFNFITNSEGESRARFYTNILHFLRRSVKI